MKKFFQTVKDSVYNPQFYKDIQQEGTAVSVKYFAKIVFTLACVVSIVPIIGGIGLLTWKHNVVDRVRAEITGIFPQELILQAKNGELSTNVAEPYAIEFSESIKREMSSDDRAYPVNNLLVINTGKPIEIGDFSKYKTFVILGKDEVGVFDSQKGKLQIQNFRNNNFSGTLDRAGFEVFVNKLFSIVQKVAVVILILLPFLIFAGLFVWYGVYLVFGAIIVWLAAKATHQSLTYGQSYRLGLHLVTLPLIISFLLPFLFGVPFMFTLALFVIAFVNFKQTCECADGKNQTAVVGENKEVIEMTAAHEDKVE